MQTLMKNIMLMNTNLQGAQISVLWLVFVDRLHKYFVCAKKVPRLTQEIKTNNISIHSSMSL